MPAGDSESSRPLLRDEDDRNVVRPTRPAIYQLEVFLKVVETRSFAATARQLGRTQPAVSQVIARLEDLYGGDLFERRRGSPVSLTPIGEAILPSARMLLHTLDHHMARAAQTAQSRTGSLGIGFYPGIASGALHDGIVEFVATSPGVHLYFVEAMPRELHQLINARSIDIMFVALLPDIASTFLVQERLWNERLVVAMRDDHPLAVKDSLDWRDISSLSLMLRSSEGDISSYRAILARMGDRPLDCEQHDVSRGALLEMVRMGLGQTISFESATVPRPGIAFRPILDENAFATIEAAWPKEDRNPIRHRLLNCVRKHGRNLG